MVIIESYRQGPGVRPEVTCITIPSLHPLQWKILDTCNKSGEKLLMKYTKLLCHLIADVPEYLEVIRNKVIF